MKLTPEQLHKMVADIVGKTLAEKIESERAKSVEAEVKRQLGLIQPAGDPARKYIDTLAMNAAKAFTKIPLGKKNVDEMTAAEKGIMAARCLRYQFVARGNPELALAIAKQADDDTSFHALGKALGESTLSAGGALIPPEFAAGIIELLYAAAIMRKAGVTVLPMTRGSLTLPYISSGASASYVGENTDGTASTPGTGELNLFWHKLFALVAMSNDMLRDGGSQIDQVIRNDLVKALATKEDITFIRSTGESGEPAGMKTLVDSGNTYGANTTETVATANAELAKAIQLLKEANVGVNGDLSGCGWIMAPRTEMALSSAKTSTGQKVWPEMADGKLMGYPYFVTSQIPINLGGASQSEVYFAHFPTLVIGEATELEVEMFPNGTHYDGSAVRSGISRDQSVMRAIARHDFGARQRGKEIVCITTVEWGKSTFA